MTISNERRIRLERAIISALIRHMNRRGWSVSNVWNGETHEYTQTIEQAVDAVFAVDEASLRFVQTEKLDAYNAERKVSERPASREADSNHIGGDYWDDEHGVLLVLGNGEDVISDWNFHDGDEDGFDAAMGKFRVERVRA